MPWEALRDLTSVQALDMSYNNLTRIGKHGFGSLSAFIIDLSHNNISDIALSAFEGLLYLVTLRLNNNNLHDIPIGGFKGNQKFLESLGSHNLLC